MASTDPRAVEMDAAQDKQGDGPCLRAAATNAVVRVDVTPTPIRALGDEIGFSSSCATSLPAGSPSRCSVRTRLGSRVIPLRARLGACLRAVAMGVGGARPGVG